MQDLKIYVLSLKRASQRRELMREQFKSLPQGFSMEFFDAIDARAGEHLAFKQYSKIGSFLVRGKEMSDGERACFASHYSLWQKCIELNAPIVVLEDDVRLMENFWSELGRIRESEYVYVRLMYSSRKASFYPLGDDVFINFDTLAGTQGYYLTPQAAKAFIKSAKCWYRPVDDYMDMFYIHHVPIVSIKPVLTELEVETMIAGRWQKPSFGAKVVREIVRLVLQIRKQWYIKLCKKNLLLPSHALKALTLFRGGGGV